MRMAVGRTRPNRKLRRTVIAELLGMALLSSTLAAPAPAAAEPSAPAQPHPASTSASAEVPLPGGEMHYWAGTSLRVDGWVSNNTDASVGPVSVHVAVRDPEGTLVAEATVEADVYELMPGRDASFSHAFELPANVGQEMEVSIDVNGTQPCAYSGAVDLMLWGGEIIAHADGERRWILHFGNGSPYTIRAPRVGGWELDELGGRADCLIPVSDLSGVVIEPYSVLDVEVSAFRPEFSPYLQQGYGQGLMLDVLIPVYRVYNKRSNWHFYTTAPHEVDALTVDWPNFVSEGIAYFFSPDNNTIPLHRFQNRLTRGYFYSAEPQEVAVVRGSMSNNFFYDGPAYEVNLSQVPDSFPVHRFFNARNGNHFYTSSAEELEMVKLRLADTWRYEGIAFWVGQ